MNGVFFVNKTGSSVSLSRSLPNEAAAVLSHVQRKRRKAEGRDQNKPWSTFISVLQPLATLEIEEGLKQTREDTLVPAGPRAPPLSPSQMPRTYPSSNAYDPFHCTIIGTDAETHALLHRTFFDVARGNFIAEAFAPDPQKQSERTPEATSRHTAIITARLKRCVDDKLLMYATLAYSASILGWTTGRFRHKKPPEFFIAKALPELRLRLGQRDYLVDDWLLLSLYSLAITESWNGLPVIWRRHPGRCDMVLRTAAESLEASRAHLRALMRLVANFGGWQLFDPYIFDSTVMADKYLAIATMKPPMLPMSWDPGPLTDNIRAELNITESAYPCLGKRLLKEPLAARLITTLEDLIMHCRVSHDIWSRSDSVSPELETWLFQRFQAIQYRLLFQYHDDSSLYHDRCTSLAALVFACVTTPSHGPQLGATYLAQALRSVLEEEDPTSADHACQNLKLWYVFVGSLVRGPSENQSWFAQRLQSYTGEHDSMVELSSLMEEYLFLPVR